ncbi:hypothetical protein QQG74_09170 [Micromonospora sp. FIMYZ51]|uniref:hypothetical protein n=1 Tax=Micromonospora sp. FIMYZ51 TaxID=3051832 RepID=UPI00311FF509
MTDLPAAVTRAAAVAAQFDMLADTLEAINRTDPSPDRAGEIRAYRIVAGRLRNKANPATEASR